MRNIVYKSQDGIEGRIHRATWTDYVSALTGETYKSGIALCGLHVINKFDHPTTKPVTCKSCLRIMKKDGAEQLNRSDKLSALDAHYLHPSNLQRGKFIERS